MKKIFAAACCLIVMTAQAQKSGSPAKSNDPVLKTHSDSMSYAVGMSVIGFYKQQGIDLNADLVAKAIKDITSNKQPLLTEEQSNLLFMCHQNPQLCENVKKGEDFLEENKKNPNVKVTASGLQYEIITLGTGPKPLATDMIVAHYTGKLLTGTEFDNSLNRGVPLTILANRVIKGWTEGLQLMPVGSKFKFYVPYQLGYGLNDHGPSIPGGSVLIFEIELLEIKAKQ